MKLLHISDLHFHRYDKDNKKTTEALNFVSQQFPDHHLVVTGDITDDGHEVQYDRAYDALKRFVPKLHLSPGNHDFGFAGNFYDKRRAKLFDQYLSTQLGQNGKFKGFNKPVVNNLEENGTQVVLISLDSNRETWWPGDFACGRIGLYQRWHLKRLLNRHSHAVRIVCFHHHPFERKFYLKMTDADKVMKVLKGRVDVVMFGHRHKQEYRENFKGIPHVLAAPAIFEDEGTAWEITIEGRDISVRKTPIV
jgi:3',5'-cyclic AMP phosphodiesterase CpdA